MPAVPGLEASSRELRERLPAPCRRRWPTPTVACSTALTRCWSAPGERPCWRTSRGADSVSTRRRAWTGRRQRHERCSRQRSGRRERCWSGALRGRLRALLRQGAHVWAVATALLEGPNADLRRRMAVCLPRVWWIDRTAGRRCVAGGLGGPIRSPTRRPRRPPGRRLDIMTRMRRAQALEFVLGVHGVFACVEVAALSARIGRRVGGAAPGG